MPSLNKINKSKWKITKIDATDIFFTSWGSMIYMVKYRDRWVAFCNSYREAQAIVRALKPYYMK